MHSLLVRGIMTSLGVVLLTAGCGAGQDSDPSSDSGSGGGGQGYYAKAPAECAPSIAAAEGEIAGFVGGLYIDTVGFESRPDSGSYGVDVLACSASYFVDRGGDSKTSDSGVDLRTVYFAYLVDTDESDLESPAVRTAKGFQQNRPVEAADCQAVGEECYLTVDEQAGVLTTVLNTRVGNVHLKVRLATSGEGDVAGRFGSRDEKYAREIAIALTNQIELLVPR